MATMERQAPPAQARSAAAPDARARVHVPRGAALRDFNDKLIRLFKGAAHELALIACECSRPGCAKPLRVTPEEYEAARLSPFCFLLTPGHESPGGQRVLMRTERFIFVEKRRALHAVATNDRETGNGRSSRPTRDFSLVPQTVGADGSGA